eukprot:5669752-Amphidinium_carterae.1
MVMTSMRKPGRHLLFWLGEGMYGHASPYSGKKDEHETAPADQTSEKDRHACASTCYSDQKGESHKKRERLTEEQVMSRPSSGPRAFKNQ